MSLKVPWDKKNVGFISTLKLIQLPAVHDVNLCKRGLCWNVTDGAS